jgi:hypothetical protein
MDTLTRLLVQWNSKFFQTNASASHRPDPRHLKIKKNFLGAFLVHKSYTFLSYYYLRSESVTFVKILLFWIQNASKMKVPRGFKDPSSS